MIQKIANQLKKLSYWALLHPFLAQSFIAFSQTTLSFLAIMCGIHLFVKGVLLPYEFFYVGAVLFVFAFVFYPIRRSRFHLWRSNYVRQKILDFTLIVAGFGVTLTLANRDAFSAYRAIMTQNEAFEVKNIVFSTQKERVEETAKNINQPKPKGFRALKKELRQQYRTYLKERKEGGYTDYDTGMIVLGVLVGLILAILTTYVSCVIACSSSGSGGAALIFLFGGLFLSTLAAIGIAKVGAKRKDNYQPLPKEEGKKEEAKEKI